MGQAFIAQQWWTHVLLLHAPRVELEVDVLDPLQVDPAHVAGGGVLGLEQLLPLLEDGHHLWLVLQPVDVLVAVGVAAFQDLNESINVNK